MKVRNCLGIASLIAIAGSAVATPPTTDGVLTPGEYPFIRWAQNVPTQFGDNLADNSCNNGAVGNPGAVATGIEIKIPLTAIGSPTGPVRLCAFLNSGQHDSVSNQVLTGIPATRLGLGEPRNIDFSAAALTGNQYVTVPATAGTSPTIDGTRDVSLYGSNLANQTCRTSFGDSSLGVVDDANGSELDNISAVIRNGALYIFVGGNLSADFTKFELFIDTGTGNGYNRLPVGMPSVDYDGLARMADDGTGNGLKFDAGFTADYYLTFGSGGSPITYFPNFADLNAATGGYLGFNTPGNGGVLDLSDGGVNPEGIEVALDNSNTAGVPIACLPASGDVNEAGGSEIDNVFATIDYTTNRLYLFIGGNLQTNYNRLDLFLDVGVGGQNTIGLNPADNSAINNPDAHFNSLGATKLEGLTFDADFFAAYYITVGTGGVNPTNMYIDACVLRPDGQRADGSGLPYDYGSYAGGVKPNTPPHVTFSGTRIDAQTGSETHIYSNYPPRIGGDRCYAASPAAPDPLNPFPLAGLLQASLDNSNVAGVGAYPDGDPCDASNVATGVEIEIDLNELGWDPNSGFPIKLAGFINSGDHKFMSNQVIGGLPSGTANLGAPSAVNFANIAGNQFVLLSNCPADFDGNTFVNGDDFDSFVQLFVDGSQGADFDHNCFVNGDDFDNFVNFFVAGC